ncbi:hypothetical protein G6F56_002432 [Rhizopus delemar]|nr:hypothetical protein G6F56_002432 [Rhizopus delemar]
MKYLCHSIDEIFDSKFTKNVEFNQVLKSVQGVENSDYEHFVDTLFKPDTDKQEELKKLFDSIKKTTAKEDLLYHIKMEMLMQVAEREGCTYIFFGDSATRQAIKMISWTAKGRGYSLPLDISVDTEIRGMGIMRPMKDMLSKEIGLYNHFSALQVLPPYNYSTMMPPKSSIDRLTEGFINSLERDFPSTVSTVCRTTLKLTPAKDMDMSRQCAVCMMPYQTGITEWRKHITVAQVPEKAEKETCCKENCCKDTKVDMNQHVCYSCQVDFKDYSPETIERLPGFVHQKVIEQGRQDRLLNEIKDFLINDDE